MLSDEAFMPVVATEGRTNLLGLDREGLKAYCADLGEKPFRAEQVLKWVHQFGASDFEAMTNLGKALRARLAEVAELRAPEVIRQQTAADGTVKWLLRMDCGNAVEMVFIPEPDRGTLCVSSQVGCSLNCSFCATARQGFARNLTSAEIIGQLWLADRALGQIPHAPRHITNVVMMGMGEPLLNFEAVVPALRLMLDDCAYGLSRKRVTLSTAGVVPGIDRLAGACAVSLAISLHAPDDELRNELVPLNRKYPLDELLAACRRYSDAGPRSEITFEYVLLDGVNDTPEHARRLARLLRSVPAKINLIPFNPFSGSGYARSPQPVIDAFRERLQSAGYVTVTRRPRGDDIDAACGQLAGQVQDRTSRSRRMKAVGAT